jgi:hypothetical protein
MKVFILGGLLLAAVVCAGVAYSGASPSAKLAKQDRVWGGGHIPAGCAINNPDACIPIGRNFAVDAHAEADGSEAVGNSSSNAATSRTVTCEQVSGNAAVVGGVITAGPTTGAGYAQYFVDRGTTSPTTPQHDLASLIITEALDDPTWPIGFPFVCPPAVGTSTLPALYIEMDYGDITVQDALDN